MTHRHLLTIRPTATTGLEGHLLFDDGSERVTFRGERAQILGWAQRAVEQHHQQPSVVLQPETLILDQDGLIVREPAEHSVRVAS